MKKHLLTLGILALGATTSAQASLVAYFDFDNAANTFEDSSGNGNDISGNAGTDPIWGASTGFNGSGAFDYSADRLIVPVDVNPTAMPQMSWGAWVRTDDLASGLRKFLGHDNGAWDRTLGLDNRAPNGDFRFAAFTGASGDGPVEGGPEPTNTTDWAFVAASHDQLTNTVTLFVDLDASTTSDPLVVITETNANFGLGFTSFAIGGIRPDLPNEAWDGAIDQVFVFDEFLDAQAMTAFRNNGAIPEPTGILFSAFGSLVILLRRRR